VKGFAPGKLREVWPKVKTSIAINPARAIKPNNGLIALRRYLGRKNDRTANKEKVPPLFPQ
jgi:hypothetical protein